MLFMGLMSGTSADAIDAALISLSGDELEIIDYRQYPLSAELQNSLRSVNRSSPIDAVSALDCLVGQRFAEAALALLEANHTDATQVLAIGSHGQTVLHLPDESPSRTLQAGDPNRIAALTGIATVADFRRADLAAGGQGAPLAPAFHAWQFRSTELNRAVLNIGGIANITILPADPGAEPPGFDTGPGNTLMDAWIQQRLGRAYDEEGRWAARGSVRQDLLEQALADPWFTALPPKSTGKDDFNLAWLASHIDKTGSPCRDEDVQATLLELTARSIAEAITAYASDAEELLVCGGGIHNPVLMQRLCALLSGIAVKSTGDYGIDPDAVEAVAFAWLARQRLENIPANLPSVTGASRPVVLGAIYQPG